MPGVLSSRRKVVAEVNNGGEMVEAILRVVDDNLAYTALHATRGKVVRAEPVAALYEQSRIRQRSCKKSGNPSEKDESDEQEIMVGIDVSDHRWSRVDYRGLRPTAW